MVIILLRLVIGCKITYFIRNNHKKWGEMSEKRDFWTPNGCFSDTKSVF